MSPVTGEAEIIPGHEGKQKLVEDLLDDVFAWARSRGPVQPLTSGVWEHDDWSSLDKLDPIEKIQIEQSDVISFHDYNWPETFERRVRQLQIYKRPILCTEYMARGNGSTFDGSMLDWQALQRRDDQLGSGRR